MTLQQYSSKDLLWYGSSHLDVIHGMFTRLGGVSIPPHASLNLSRGVGDDPQAVEDNRSVIKQALSITRIVALGQVHGDKILKVMEGEKDLEVNGYDALVSNIPGTGLLIQQADCQAVLLHDPTRGVIGAAHCGWRGTIANIIAKTIDMMISEYFIDPKNLLALISPSLGPCCAQFINHQAELPNISPKYRVYGDHFNFWEISRDQLRDSGVQETNIVSSKICTSCDERFFSYRRAVRSGYPITGRNGSVIALPKFEAKKIAVNEERDHKPRGHDRNR